MLIIAAALWGLISSWGVALIPSWELFSNYVVILIILTHEEDYEDVKDDDNYDLGDNNYDVLLMLMMMYLNIEYLSKDFC